MRRTKQIQELEFGIQIQITQQTIDELLEYLKEYNLQDYFNYDEEEYTKNSQRALENLKELIQRPKILKYDEESDYFFVYSANGEKIFVIYKTSAINSFDQTHINIAEKLLDIYQVFISNTVGDFTKEQKCFYICINIAGVFGGKFRTSFEGVWNIS